MHLYRDPIYSFLEDYLPALDNAFVIEIGAHNGRDTAWMLDLLRRPFWYFAFEPDPRNYRALTTNIDRTGNIYLENFAVGDQDGAVTLYQSGGRKEPERGPIHTDSSSIKQPSGIKDKYPWMTFEPVDVPIIRLDSYAKHRRIYETDFIWADVQGAELDLIHGGQETLLQTKYFYTECYENVVLYKGQPTLEQIERVLPGDWKVIFRTRTDVLLENITPDIRRLKP